MVWIFQLNISINPNITKYIDYLDVVTAYGSHICQNFSYCTLGGPWRDRGPTWAADAESARNRSPRRGATSECPLPALAAQNDTQASRCGADSNFPFYLLVQGQSESLTGPQTSCQELLIRTERHQECTRPPLSKLAGQSAWIDRVRQAERGTPPSGAGRGGGGEPGAESGGGLSSLRQGSA